MILTRGDKILVGHRRLMERDEPRFFLARVDAYEAGVMKATGHSFVRDVMVGHFVRKPDPRTKLLSLASGTLLCYALPDDVALESVEFRSENGGLWITDGQSFEMNLSEHLPAGEV